jgi:molybdenum cofactor cytidylyltransferase
MGRPKAWLTLGPNGPTFVDAITSTLVAAGIAAVRVVVAPGIMPRSGTLVVNPDPSAGMLSSVTSGLAALGNELDAALVWPVDHPLVRRETIEALVAAFRDVGAPVVVPTFEGRRGHPVLFAARVLPEIYAADPAIGARAVVHAHDDRVELPVSDRGIIEGIDTPEDYRRVFGTSFVPEVR